MSTGSPTFTRVCWEASSAIVTTRLVDVTLRTGPAWTAAPFAGVTLVTRAAPGSKTTEPSRNCPVCGSPFAAWNAVIAAAVSDVNASPAGRP